MAVRRVDGGATLKLQMLRYRNPDARDYDGYCCDVFCWSDCDYIFRFALDVGDRSIAFYVARGVATAQIFHTHPHVLDDPVATQLDVTPLDFHQDP